MKTPEIRSSESGSESRRRKIGWALGAFVTTALAVGANLGMALHSSADSAPKAKPASRASAPLRPAAIAKPAPEASNAAAAVIVPTIEAANPFNAQNLEIAGLASGVGAAGLSLIYVAARRSRRASQAPQDKSLTNELGLRIINVEDPADGIWRPDADIVDAAMQTGVTEDTMARLELQDNLNDIFDAHHEQALARIEERKRTEATIAAMMVDIDTQCVEALALPQPVLAAGLAA